jgi:hypothetical protein
LVGQTPVHLGLDADSVVSEKQGVEVEVERHRRVAQLADAIPWLEPSSEADLDDLLAEGANGEIADG